MKWLKLGFYAVVAGAIVLPMFLSSPEPSDTGEYFYQLGWDESVNLVGRYPAKARACQKTACYRLSYDESARLSLIEFLDQGHLASDFWLEVAKIEFDYGEQGSIRRFYDAAGNPTTDTDGVHAEVLQFRPDLNVWIKQHQNADNQLVANVRGVYGYVEVLDDAGVKMASQPLDQNFELTTDNHGIAKKIFTRNAAGFVTETRNYDAEGNLMGRLNDGVAIVKKTVNSQGDVLSAAYYDADEKLIEQLRWAYDARGKVLRGAKDI